MVQFILACLAAVVVCVCTRPCPLLCCAVSAAHTSRSSLFLSDHAAPSCKTSSKDAECSLPTTRGPVGELEGPEGVPGRRWPLKLPLRFGAYFISIIFVVIINIIIIILSLLLLLSLLQFLLLYYYSNSHH